MLSSQSEDPVMRGCTRVHLLTLYRTLRPGFDQGAVTLGAVGGATDDAQGTSCFFSYVWER